MQFDQVRKLEIFQPLQMDLNDLKKGDLFNKKIMVKAEFPDINIEFTIEGNSGITSDRALIKVYGISRETFSFFGKVLNKKLVIPVKLYSGHETNNGVIFKGVVERVTFNYNGRDPYLELVCNENDMRMTGGRLGITFSSTNKLNIVKELCRMMGYSDRYIDIPERFNTYMSRYTVRGNFREALEELCKDSKLDFKYDAENVYVYPAVVNFNSFHKIDFRNGLLTYPRESNNNTFEFETLINHNVRVNYVFAMDYENNFVTNINKGDEVRYYIVTKYSHKTNGLNAVTSVRCKLTDPDPERAKNIDKLRYENDRRENNVL